MYISLILFFHGIVFLQAHIPRKYPIIFRNIARESDITDSVPILTQLWHEAN